MDRGEVLLAARRRKQMSQEHLASVAEVSVRTIRRAERGEEVSGESLRCLCAVLEVDVETLPQGRVAEPLRAASDQSSLEPTGDHLAPIFPGYGLPLVLALLAVSAAPMVAAAFTLIHDRVPNLLALWITAGQCLMACTAVEIDKRMGLVSAIVLLGFAQICGAVLWLVTFGAVMPFGVQVAEVAVVVAGIGMMALGIREQGRARADGGGDVTAA